MAKYRVTDALGRSFVINGGDTPPTQEQVAQLIAGYDKGTESQTPAVSVGELKKGLTPWQRVGQGLKHDFEDMGYGIKKGLSGATLGASDWALRKLGITDDDYLARREAEGLGGAVKAAGFGAELGGNMLGAGGALVKGLGKSGLKGLKLASTAGGIEGGITGGFNSDTLDQLPTNVVGGGAWSAALPVGISGLRTGLKNIVRPFSSRLMTEGMQGGLSNVAGNPQAVKLLKQGIRGSDEVAEEYLNKVRPATRGINQETANMVDSSLTSRINVPETIAAERARYGDYMSKHGADEVFDFAPTRGQLASYKAQSSFNPNSYSKVQAENVLRDRAEKSGVEIGGDLGHFSKRPDRTETVRTLSNTLENPDIVYSKGDKGYVVKKYDTNGKPFFDFITKKDGKLWTKFPTDPSYLENQIKNSAENVSLSGRVTGVQPGLIHSLPPTTDNNIPLRGVVVNSELPHFNTLYDGLTDFQAKSLKQAANTGFSKTNAKAGSLESMNKVKQELNEMISKAQTTDKPSEVWQLQELKGKFDNAMPAGLKDVDRGFARAKRLEDAFNRGAHYNPNNVSGADNIAALPSEEQNAFAQGLFKRINNNSLTGKNLAEDALKYENTLAQVLPINMYNPLMQGLNRQSSRFGRLSELGRAAENKLRAPEGTRLFGREQLESKGSMIGSAVDWANNLLRGRAIERASQNLMNPEFVGEPFVDSLIVRNPNLAAGLSATAYDNMRNWNR